MRYQFDGWKIATNSHHKWDEEGHPVLDEDGNHIILGSYDLLTGTMRAVRKDQSYFVVVSISEEELAAAGMPSPKELEQWGDEPAPKALVAMIQAKIEGAEDHMDRHLENLDE